MTDLSCSNETPMSAKSPKSSPIPIVSAAKPAANFRGGFVVEKQLQRVEVDELSESYTCGISRFGNNLVKRVYFDDKLSGVVNDCEVRTGVFSASPMSVGEVGRDFWASDFLSSCYFARSSFRGWTFSCTEVKKHSAAPSAVKNTFEATITKRSADLEQ